MPRPGRAVEEERVVGLAGELGDRERGGVGEPVPGADHEALEGVGRDRAAATRPRRSSSAGRAAGSRALRARSTTLDPGPRRSRSAASSSAAVAALDPGAGRPWAPRRRGCRPGGRPAAADRSRAGRWTPAGRRRAPSLTRLPDRGRDRLRGASVGTARDHRTGRGAPRARSRPDLAFRGRKNAAPRHRDSRRPRRRRLYCLAGREADLPAQEAQARPDPRVSRSHAHARRPRDHQAPAPQGSQAADAVSAGSPRERRRRGRLSRSGDFDRVYREGRSHANRFLVLYAFPRGEPRGRRDEVRLGVSVSRKVGGAVERNAVKRALREAFWSLGDALPLATTSCWSRGPTSPGWSSARAPAGSRPRSRSWSPRPGLAGGTV